MGIFASLDYLSESNWEEVKTKKSKKVKKSTERQFNGPLSWMLFVIYEISLLFLQNALFKGTNSASNLIGSGMVIFFGMAAMPFPRNGILLIQGNLPRIFPLVILNKVSLF